MRILVIDIGGTWTRIAVAQPTRGSTPWAFGTTLRLRSAGFRDFTHLLDSAIPLLDGIPKSPAAIGIALAGPITGHGLRCSGRPTNLPWPELDASRIARQSGSPVVLINDFAAVGWSLAALGPGDRVTLQAGHPDPDGLCLAIGAGTGLGSCVVVGTPAREVFAGEGGHAEFAASDHEQSELVEWIRSRAGRCSREHILSGSGIARLGAFLQEREPDPDVQTALSEADPAQAIGDLARAGHPPAQRIMRWFVRMLAEQIGDIALGALPRGGIFIAGGIAPKWRDLLETDDFTAAFCRKPPMQDLMERLPVHLVTYPEPGLLGIAVAAAASLHTSGDLA